eukprot:CAMPEP_0170518900 /NCGR_PEP_ID=MMETSP0209-20121228/4493_1 /TAXON_ID=665100 ORGANISM="Litonotus pictus, Strain P1" /NCGR_SAMPLE_ID=MMETSP0209 /ASSEMBLY_ACC=CAM_ASM_000301 /LENGTH=1203 /DNA_ID=CAMNT_0010804651 /DNA_START=222 /DNA_END=3830 /DNA_ORIENTATION=+
MIGTFAIVLVFTMLKEGYEDILRYRADKKINEKESLVYDYSQGSFEKKMWWKIKVGDLIKIHSYEEVPCDTMILKSSLDSGMCFLDTMNLDGETNLKEKMTFKDTKDLSDEAIIGMKAKVICDEADENLEKWDANAEVEDMSFSVLIGNAKNILLKGCTLRNTDYILGIAVYTGHSTKIMKNSKPPEIKRSNVMIMMNYLLYSIFGFLGFICLLFSILYIVWQDEYGTKMAYMWEYDDDGEPDAPGTEAYDWFIKFLTFIIAYSHIIPISLYVGLEVLKMVQTILIACDAKMFDPEVGKNAEAKTSDLIEELGQIEFIFSDKTGTLTKNEMIFRKCSINNVVYGNPSNNLNEQTSKESKYLLNGDPAPFKVLGNSNNSEYQNIVDFFTICSVCHEAYVEEKNGKNVIQSSSPDEVALIQGAKMVGFNFVTKTSGSIETYIEHTNEKIVWDLHLVLKFDSTRKRMSIIVNKQGTDEYVLFTKGADTQMLSAMTIESSFLSTTNKHLSKFAKEALRTLVMAKKELSKETVDEYVRKFNDISGSTSASRDDDLLDLFNEIESGFHYVGSSAIEDKLQENVGSTIESLMNAKIRVWVLTGDKKETAIEIGKSCRLVHSPEEMDAIDLANTRDINDTKQEVEEKVNKWFYKFYSDRENEEIEKQAMYSEKNLLKENIKKKMWVIVDGLNLAHILADDKLSRKFFRVGLLANSVICCRVSPKQKSQVVKLAQTNGTWITLSIGDGANDVPMILTANIGIGISGKEGTQAVRSADYALGQFQFLRQIVMVHGRLGYKRISSFIFYYFYKNILLVFVEMYFAIFSGFSGMIFFPDFLPLLYNALWTSWPCMFAYSIERDADEETSIICPILYEAGQRKYYFNMKNFWIWIIWAFLHGVMIYFIGLEALEYFYSPDGKTHDNWLKSTVLFSIIVHVVTYKIFIELRYWNLFNLVSALCSILFYYFTVYILCQPLMARVFNPELIEKIFEALTYGRIWIIFFWFPVIILLPDIAYNLIKTIYDPTPTDVIISNEQDFKESQRQIDIKQLTEIVDPFKDENVDPKTLDNKGKNDEVVKEGESKQLNLIQNKRESDQLKVNAHQSHNSQGQETDRKNLMARKIKEPEYSPKNNYYVENENEEGAELNVNKKDKKMSEEDIDATSTIKLKEENKKPKKEKREKKEKDGDTKRDSVFADMDFDVMEEKKPNREYNEN